MSEPKRRSLAQSLGVAWGYEDAACFRIPLALRTRITVMRVARGETCFAASCFLLFVAPLRRCVRLLSEPKRRSLAQSLGVAWGYEDAACFRIPLALRTRITVMRVARGETCFTTSCFLLFVAPLRRCVRLLSEPKRRSLAQSLGAAWGYEDAACFRIPLALRTRITVMRVARGETCFTTSCFLLFVAPLRRCVRLF